MILYASRNDVLTMLNPAPKVAVSDPSEPDAAQRCRMPAISWLHNHINFYLSITTYATDLAGRETLIPPTVFAEYGLIAV